MVAPGFTVATEAGVGVPTAAGVAAGTLGAVTLVAA